MFTISWIYKYVLPKRTLIIVFVTIVVIPKNLHMHLIVRVSVHDIMFEMPTNKTLSQYHKPNLIYSALNGQAHQYRSCFF